MHVAVRRAALLLPAWAWLLAFVAAPGALLVVIGLATPADAVPPYRMGLSIASLRALADTFYLRALLGSLLTATVVSALCLLIGTPMAMAIARSRRRQFLLLLVVFPFWSGMLLRIVAWVGILRDDGLANAILLRLHLIKAPIPLLHSDSAMLLGLVTCYLPFFILPLEARLAAIGTHYAEAAADLGAPPWRVFRRITFPLALPGVWAGLALVFLPVSGEYVIPEMLGAPASPMLGRVIWDTFFHEGDWPQAAILAVALLILLLLPAVWLRRGDAGAQVGGL